ncbi:TPA: hypothetical protein DCZ17_03665 [Candidatus Collierbacteria bacterium]|nr:hypothetical protein [Candidatus Collierbacteria bacterium]
MTKWGIFIGLLALLGGIFWGVNRNNQGLLSPLGEITEKTYEKYSFTRLVSRGGQGSQIETTGNKFYYRSEGRRISGMVNSPSGQVKGIIVMARGYVEKEEYQTGTGTKNAAKYYSEQGYWTYAPDFSGYGESDPEDSNALGARLVKPVEILDLIASLSGDLPIYLWGHSNGGQIMLSVAEILGARGETRVKGVTLWAPVSKPFPYNILYYTDDASDSGKWLRGQVAQFEQDYDVFNYSIDRYWEWITLPIQIHQGTMDLAVPKIWSDQLVEKLLELDKTVKYYVYPGADHNLRPGWDQVVARDDLFFTSLN